MVASHSSNSIRVKLTDPGILLYSDDEYNALFSRSFSVSIVISYLGYLGYRSNCTIHWNWFIVGVQLIYGLAELACGRFFHMERNPVLDLARQK